jgi:hypothetical protein
MLSVIAVVVTESIFVQTLPSVVVVDVDICLVHASLPNQIDPVKGRISHSESTSNNEITTAAHQMDGGCTRAI